MTVQIDAFGDSINQYGEQMCGDRVEIVRSSAGVTALLADGRGGGVKANMLASLAAQMTAALLGRGASVEEIADMLVESQPAGREEETSYSAFTLVQANTGGMIFTAQMETPDVLLFQRGKPVGAETHRRMRQGRLIRLGAFSCREADTVVAVGSGVLAAGEEHSLRKGWRLQDVSCFMAHTYRPGIPAEKLVRLLLNAGSTLSDRKQKDDLSAIAVRVKNIPTKSPA